MALHLAEAEPRNYMYVCTPTGDELPEMIVHWKQLGELLGKPLLPITGGISLQGLIRRERMLPNNKARWCTRKLKLEPYYRWLGEQTPCVSYVGLRADEPSRVGMEFPAGNGIDIRFPMREWGWKLVDVLSYLEQRNIHIPARTDCARCYHQTLGEWWRLWKIHPEIYRDAERQEIQIQECYSKNYTFRSPQRDTWPADLSKLRQRFEDGHVPPRTIIQEDIFTGGARRPTMCRPCSL